MPDYKYNNNNFIMMCQLDRPAEHKEVMEMNDRAELNKNLAQMLKGRCI